MKTEFKIEKGVALPPPKRRYPFSEMKIGDSFFIPVEDPRTPDGDNRIRATVHTSARNRKIVATIQKVKGGFRVWKIGERTKKRKGAK